MWAKGPGWGEVYEQKVGGGGEEQKTKLKKMLLKKTGESRTPCTQVFSALQGRPCAAGTRLGLGPPPQTVLDTRARH